MEFTDHHPLLFDFQRGLLKWALVQKRRSIGSLNTAPHTTSASLLLLSSSPKLPRPNSTLLQSFICSFISPPAGQRKNKSEHTSKLTLSIPLLRCVWTTVKMATESLEKILNDFQRTRSESQDLSHSLHHITLIVSTHRHPSPSFNSWTFPFLPFSFVTQWEDEWKRIFIS